MVIADYAIWSTRKHFYWGEFPSFMRIADRGIDLTKSSQLKTGAADEGLNGLAFCPQCEKTEKMILLIISKQMVCLCLD